MATDPTVAAANRTSRDLWSIDGFIRMRVSFAGSPRLGAPESSGLIMEVVAMPGTDDRGGHADMDLATADVGATGVDVGCERIDACPNH